MAICHFWFKAASVLLLISVCRSHGQNIMMTGRYEDQNDHVVNCSWSASDQTVVGMTLYDVQQEDKAFVMAQMTSRNCQVRDFLGKCIYGSKTTTVMAVISDLQKGETRTFGCNVTFFIDELSAAHDQIKVSYDDVPSTPESYKIPLWVAVVGGLLLLSVVIALLTLGWILRPNLLRTTIRRLCRFTVNKGQTTSPAVDDKSTKTNQTEIANDLEDSCQVNPAVFAEALTNLIMCLQPKNGGADSGFSSWTDSKADFNDIRRQRRFSVNKGRTTSATVHDEYTNTNQTEIANVLEATIRRLCRFTVNKGQTTSAALDDKTTKTTQTEIANDLEGGADATFSLRTDFSEYCHNLRRLCCFTVDDEPTTSAALDDNSTKRNQTKNANNLKGKSRQKVSLKSSSEDQEQRVALMRDTDSESIETTVDVDPENPV